MQLRQMSKDIELDDVHFKGFVQEVFSNEEVEFHFIYKNKIVTLASESTFYLADDGMIYPMQDVNGQLVVDKRFIRTKKEEKSLLKRIRQKEGFAYTCPCNGGI